MLPGAVDVVPLKVQLSALPPLTIEQVSVSVGPVTPKLAVASVGFVTESVADAVPPPYAAVSVPAIVPPTSLVMTVKVALDAPADTTTVAGTVSGSLAVRITLAPPTGAEAVNPTVALTVVPPTAVEAANESVATATDATVTVGDWLLLLLSDAVTLAVPAAMPVMVNAAVVAPACTATGDCTATTPGLLLASVMLAAVAEAAASVTVPWLVPPTPILDALNVTPEIPGPVGVGADGELELPHPETTPAAARIERVTTTDEVHSIFMKS
jgi:hypothetical protein